MPYTSLPAQLCPTGSWPAGPFTGGDDAGAQAAAAAVASMAAAITARRKQLRWSRAALAEQSGVGQHTVGRIEAGRTWPDVATVARLAHALGLGLELTLSTNAAAPALAGPPAPTAVIPAPRPTPEGPLNLGLTPGDGVSAAHVIEALLGSSPRLRQEVERLAYLRRTGGGRLVARGGTRL